MAGHDADAMISAVGPHSPAENLLPMERSQRQLPVKAGIEDGSEDETAEQYSEGVSKDRLFSSDWRESLRGLADRVACPVLAPFPGALPSWSRALGAPQHDYLVFEVLWSRTHTMTTARFEIDEHLLRFFCVTAGLGLWSELERFDPRRFNLLLAYYTRDARLEDLGELAGLVGAERVRQLVAGGLSFLWRRLPNFGDPMPSFAHERCPIDKEVVFPLDQLQRSRRERGNARNGAREAARARAERIRRLEAALAAEREALSREHVSDLQVR